MAAMPRQKHTWGVAKAKAQFSALIDRALSEGPQTITRSGKAQVVVVAADEWERKTKTKGQPRRVLQQVALAQFRNEDRTR